MRGGKGLALVGAGAAVVGVLLMTKKSKAAGLPAGPRGPVDGAEVPLPGQPGSPEVTAEQSDADLLTTYHIMLNDISGFFVEDEETVVQELFSRGFRDEALNLQARIHARFHPPIPSGGIDERTGDPIFNPEDFPTEDEILGEITGPARA